MQYCTAEMYLCQAASICKTPAPLDADAAAVHADLLCSGLAAAKSLLDYYLTLPVYADMAFNNSEWIQLSFAITVACRLAVTTPSSTPQTRALRQSLDLGGVLRHLALRVGALVSQQVDARGGRDIFYRYEQRVRRMQAWYERCCNGSSSTSSSNINISSSAPRPAVSRKTSTKLEQQQQQQQQTITSAPFTHDALGLLSQPPSGATTPVSLFPSGAAEPTQFFQNLSSGAGAADPCVWSADSSQANTPDMKMTELFPELDYIFCDWLSPPIEST